MTEYHHTIQAPEGSFINVIIRRDKRLKKSSRWVRRKDGTILLRVPNRLPKGLFPDVLKDVARQLGKQQKRDARRTHADLHKRAQEINSKYFDSEIKWEAIRWVGNMNSRLGSCTTSGTTEGHIRISDKIKKWPPWVIDYVIAHELTHTIYPNHSPAFWETLTKAYPLTDRARGFIKGVSFIEGTDLEAEDE